MPEGYRAAHSWRETLEDSGVRALQRDWTMKTYLGMTMVLLTLCNASAEPDLRTKFTWRQAIAGGEETGMLYRIRTPREVFDGCRRFPSDLRILDDVARQWPFYVLIPEGKIVTETVPAKTINASVVEQKDRYVRQDVVIPADAESGKRREHNQLIIRTPGSDFVRRVEVYGGENQKDWGLLGVGYLVDHSRDVRVCNKTVRYPASTFPFMQVRVYPNALNATEPLSVEGVLVANSVEAPGGYEDVPLCKADVSEKDLKEGCQVVVFDIEAKNRPIDRLVIQAKDREYARSLRIFGRNEETNTWRWVADAEIHRLGESVQDTLSLKGFAFRFLKVELFNYDDKPLHDLRVEAQAVSRYLVTESQGGSATLYYGAPDVEAPRYDLRRRRGDEEAAVAPFLRLRDRENQFQKPAGFGKYGPWLAAGAVGLVSFLVIWIIVSMMKRQGERKDG